MAASSEMNSVTCCQTAPVLTRGNLSTTTKVAGVTRPKQTASTWGVPDVPAAGLGASLGIEDAVVHGLGVREVDNAAQVVAVWGDEVQGVVTKDGKDLIRAV